MQTIKLDLSFYEAAQAVLAKQGDVGRKFMAVITNGGEDYAISDGMTLSVWYAGTSGAGNYTKIGDHSAFSVSGNTVTVELIAQMLTNKGGGRMCLMLHGDDGTQIATWNIPYIVEHVPGADSQQATAYYTALSEASTIAATSAKLAKDAAMEARNILDNSLPKDLYSAQIIVDRNAPARTDTFWNQVFGVYNSMNVSCVKYIQARIINDYAESDPNEPMVGCYRVVITKSADADYGFVEVTSSESDETTFNGPYVMTRSKYGGTWKEAEVPMLNLYNSIRKELLWENSAAGSPIETTIQLPIRSIYYNALLIQVNLDSSKPYSASVVIRSNNVKNIGVAYFPAGEYSSETWGGSWRYFFWSDDKRSLGMSEGYYEGVRSNSRAIPFRIYGLIL